MKQFIEIPNAKKQVIFKNQELLPLNLVVEVSSVICLCSIPNESVYQIRLFDRTEESGVATFDIAEETYKSISKILLEEE